ncbi:MAG: hypothetical protein KDC91_09660, partial [Flavobacteriaceae bacterium]|nr:hypothetical protein [Flavobacteriaceae bacterium]
DSSGIYSWRWFMDEAGVDRPSRTIRDRKNEPGGTQVKPGNYKAELMYLDTTSSVTITVESDPRLDISPKAINDAYTASKALEKMTQVAADAVKQLVESKIATEDFSKKLKKEDEEKYKDNIKESKEMVKKIDSIVAFYIGKEDNRQGITEDPEVSVMQRMGIANWYSQSRPNGLTATENRLMQQAKDALEKALQSTNDFFTKDWVDFKTKMEAIQLLPFKETQTFSINKN